MAEEFQAGICGSNWWNSSRHALVASPCSVGFNDHMGSFGCPNDMVDIKATRSYCGEINNSAELVSDDHSKSIAFDQYEDVQKPHDDQHTDSASGTSATLLIDSTLQMIGFGLSSSSSTTPPSDFSQALLLSRSNSGRAESNFHNSMLQEDMANTKLNYPSGTGVGDEDSSSIINGFKPMSQDFALDQLGSSSSSFPISSSSSSASYGFPSTLLQSLFDSEVPQSQPQQSPFNNNHFSNDLLLSPSPTSNCWPPRYSPSSCLRPSSMPKPLQPGGGGGGGGLHFSNNINTPFWNAPAAVGLNHDNFRSSNGPFSSSQSQYTSPPSSTFHEQKPNCHGNFTSKANTNEDVQDSSSSVVKKGGSSICEPVFKRARIETPSPLPTFKVRKEKLGDRITALQQLVSPFGKTDTASVLHEAIEYIKFLHDQVSVLSNPYMKNGAPMQQQQGIISDHKMKDAAEGAKQDLQSRGLCLVPISSTFPVANETTADFWTPTFGATFR